MEELGRSQLSGVAILGGLNENLLKFIVMHNSSNILKAIELFTLYSELYVL